METTLPQIFKCFAFVNLALLLFLVWMALKPLLGLGTFAVVVDGWRYGYGSGGWVIQHSRTYEMKAGGWWPWYRHS